jgi:hypothetical protein
LSDDVVVISEDRYDQLLGREMFLGCLEAAGVDNWDGYSFAQDMFNEAYGEED